LRLRRKLLLESFAVELSALADYNHQVMDETERQVTFDRQTEEIYAAIGRFAVSFEHVCHAMETTLHQLLSIHGLQSGGLANAMLAGLTADPLLKIFRAAIMEVRREKMDPTDEKIVRNVVKRITALTEARNDIIHRMWFVGWAAPTDTDFSTVDGWKFKNTAAGSEFRPLRYTKTDFDSETAEANELTRIVQRMGGCLLLGKPFRLNFQLDPDGAVRLPPNTSAQVG
jgi:hypothetical protein